MHGGDGDDAPPTDGVPAGTLWWTSEKKDKMVLVERRIIAETKRAIQQRRKRKAAEAAAAAAAKEAGAQAGSTLDAAAADGVPLAKSRARVRGEEAGPPSFATSLHTYWQSVTDHRVTPDDRDSHEHGLCLASAYASPVASTTRGDCIDADVTNFTSRFADMIDYLFDSRRTLRVSSVRPLPTRAQLRANGVVGNPTAEWPSDHELIVATEMRGPHKTPLGAHSMMDPRGRTRASS